jgi:Lsr2
MAQRTQVIFEDDIDGSEAEGTVTFALNGAQYEIDLSNKNAEKLRKAFEPYVSGGRKVSARATAARSPRGTASAPKRHDQSAVREWAKSQELKISDRGRIPADVLAKYEASH